MSPDTRNSLAFILATSIAAYGARLEGWPLAVLGAVMAAVAIVAIIFRDRGGPPAVVGLLLLLLPACSFTATQTRQCALASIAAARADIAAVRACLRTQGEHPTDEAITGCVDITAEAALSSMEAGIACWPRESEEEGFR